MAAAMMVLVAAVPALVAGNCAILKPSELAGLTCMYLGQLASEAGIPPGVFSGIPGGARNAFGFLSRNCRHFCLILRAQGGG